MSDIWIPDTATYNSIQKLKNFVTFVATTKYATEVDKKTARKIVYLIDNIDKPATFKNWMVHFDILNSDLDYHHNKKSGIYQRYWCVTFEDYTLEIEAITKHTNEPLYHFGNDFEYYAAIFFKKEIPFQRFYINNSVERFVADARNYKMYKSKLMSNIELDFNVSDIKSHL